MNNASSAPVVQLNNVWKVFGRHSDDAIAMASEGRSRADIMSATGATVGVNNVSFDVGRGETFVVMGLSGSGKSTLIRCLARLIEPTKGEVRVNGDDVLAMNASQLRALRRTTMSMVFQHFGLFPHRKVIDNVAYGLEVQGVAKAERRRRAAGVLDKVGLSAWGQHFPPQLSGGMQQRVGLARALAVDPAVLLFDEPFSALDPLIRREMQDELLRLQREEQRTLVFITHDFAEAIRLGDRIAIMKDGAIDQIGTAAELVRNPATEYVREFTRDISRAEVTTAADVCDASDDPCDHHVVASARLSDIAGLLVSTTGHVAVMGADGQRLGAINRQRAAAVLSPVGASA